MNPHKPPRPVWQQGLRKRRWLFVCLLVVSVFVLGLRQYTLSWEPTGPDETDSFEYLSLQINKEDSFLSNNWRRLWSHLPGGAQWVLKNFRPALPARAQRIYACKRLRFHGHEAIPLLLSKLKASDPETVEAAMASLVEINIPTDNTWDQITHIIEDQTQPDSFRLIAFHTLIAIHHQEERSSVFINKIASSVSGWIDSIADAQPLNGDSFSTHWNKVESDFLMRSRSKLSQEFLSDLANQESTSHTHLAHYYLCKDTANAKKHHRNAIQHLFTPRASMYPKHFAMLTPGQPGILISLGTENEAYFIKAANSDSPIMHELAIKFYPHDRKITPDIAEGLIQIISGTSEKAADQAFFIYCKTSLKPSQEQYGKILRYLGKDDPLYQHLVIRAILAWSHGHLEEKLNTILACSFPHKLEINSFDLLRFTKLINQSEESRQLVMKRIETYHRRAKLMSQNAASYQKVSSKYEAIPVSMRSDYNQMCRKRSWLFGHLKETIQGHPNLMAALDESIREPMNPNRYDDAVLRWQIKPDPEIIMPLLKGAFQSDAYPSESSIRLAVLMGDQAMPLLKPFLQHEDGAVRIDIFSKICRVVENRNIITRYFTMAQEGAGETIVRRLEIYSEIYLQQ